MSKGVLRIPPQLFTPGFRSSTPGDMVKGGFFSSDSPSLALSAADSALKSGVVVRARVGHVAFARAPVLRMGQGPRSIMRCALYVGDCSEGRCRLDCLESAPWCGRVVGSGVPARCRYRFDRLAPRLVVPRGVGLAAGVGGVCACGLLAAGPRHLAYVRQAGCGRVSLCVCCPGYTDVTLVGPDVGQRAWGGAARLSRGVGPGCPG